ncbi:DNA replication complex GINS family protein [Candidatus Micrarchaeota archaeon]|nr:DNA replication complex GINS family protein [Candidatus Micrarchaeota archaeon]
MASEVSYAALRSLQTQERHSPQLLPLDSDFYQRYASWLSELEQNVRERFSLEAAKELESARKILNDVFTLRAQKIFFKALRDFRAGRVDAAGLSEQEKELYTGLVTLLSRHQLGASIPSVNGELQVDIVADVPAFVGFDAQPYGPFRPGQRVVLPRKQAEFLQRKGVVKVIS